MTKTSLANAKAHLSKLVDDVEHRGKTVLILRHGKPAAALVPVEVALPKKPRKRMTHEEAVTWLDSLARADGDGGSAVDDLIAGRR